AKRHALVATVVRARDERDALARAFGMSERDTEEERGQHGSPLENEEGRLIEGRWKRERTGLTLAALGELVRGRRHGRDREWLVARHEEEPLVRGCVVERVAGAEDRVAVLGKRRGLVAGERQMHGDRAAS